MARGKAHSDETKAAVMAALLAGQGVNEVARQYDLDSGLVSRWRRGIACDQLQQVAAQKAERIEGLLFGYLEKNLTALKAQAEVGADKSYLRQFPPQQLAVLHGVMADKAVRLLEATAREQQRPAEPEDESEDDGEDEA